MADTSDIALADTNRTFHVLQQPMRLLPNYYRWTYGRFRPWLAGTVIELGCGAGWGLPHVVDRADRVIAVDHDPVLLAGIRDAGFRNVETVAADLMPADWPELAGIRADAVLAMDVLEHFRDDRAFLATAARLLRPGGHLLVKVPADSRRYSAMDRASGYYRRYDREPLVALAQSLGLEVVTISEINRLGGLAYARRNQGKTNFSRSFAAWQLRIINLGLPLVQLADRLPLGSGLSLAAVLRRPAV